MAVNYQSSNTAAQGSYGTGLLVSAPSGLAADDLWLIVVISDQSAGVINLPTGFSEVSASFNSYPRCRAMIKKATETESNPTITTTSNEGFGIAAISVRLTGQHLTTPLDADLSTTVSGSGSTIDAPDITVAVANSLALLSAVINSTTTITRPTGSTDINYINDGGGIAIRLAYEARNAGSYTPGNWTYGTGASGRAAETFSIQPPPAEGLAVDAKYINFPKPILRTVA